MHNTASHAKKMKVVFFLSCCYEHLLFGRFSFAFSAGKSVVLTAFFFFLLNFTFLKCP